MLGPQHRVQATAAGEPSDAVAEGRKVQTAMAIARLGCRGQLSMAEAAWQCKNRWSCRPPRWKRLLSKGTCRPLHVCQARRCHRHCTSTTALPGPVLS